jgi:hypothetical protein
MVAEHSADLCACRKKFLLVCFAAPDRQAQSQIRKVGTKGESGSEWQIDRLYQVI